MLEIICLAGTPKAAFKDSSCECSLSLSLFLKVFSLLLSGTLWPFDEISKDGRRHTLTVEHLVPKSLSDMALLKYYSRFYFF